MFYTTQQLVFLKKNKNKKKKNGKKSQPSQSRNNSCFGLYVPSNLFLSVAFLVECSAVLIAVSYPL
jgi:hypothetical protein